MNDELLEDRMNRRAQEWQVGEPPFREIMGEGRRLRRRRRQWLGGVAASVAVLGLTVGGLAIAPGPAQEAPLAGPAAPPAEGRWIAVDGVALDVPSTWTGDLTACDDEQMPVWIMAGGANQEDVDPCAPGAGDFTVQFTDMSDQDIIDVELLENENPADAEVDGQPYHRDTAQCSEHNQTTGKQWCSGSVHFHDRDMNASIAGFVTPDLIDEVLATVRVLPAGLVPNPPPYVRPAEASGQQFVGIGDISFEVPAGWTERASACGPTPVGTGFTLTDARPEGQGMCDWDHRGSTGSIRFLDLARDEAKRGQLATTFHGLPDRVTMDGRAVGRDIISCSDGSCSVALYVADPGVHVTITSTEGENAVQQILNSFEAVPPGDRN